jgi:ribosomal protein S18 acetylase RimI-like enzyme
MRNAEIIIRKAAIDDAEALTQAHIRSWRAAMEGFIPAKEVAKFCDSRPQRWKEGLSREDHTTHAVLLDGEIVGWFAFGPCRGDFADDRYCHLYAIYLDPSAQRRGAGRQIMAYAEERAREMGKSAMVLKVFAKNKSSRRFYEACGYHKDGRGRVRRDYGRRLRVLRYVKEI